MKPDLSVEIAGIRMKNPVMNAAGTFEPEENCISLVRPQKLGAVVSKTVTPLPRDGNPQPRIFEVESGMINRIGLQNPGVERFIEAKLPQFQEMGVPLIVNIAGESIGEFCQVAAILQKKAGDHICAFEANVSCPNVRDGLIFGSDPKLLFRLVESLKANTSLPLIIKLTPNVTDIGIIARAAQDGGANAISLINTVKASAFILRGPHAGRWIEGGLSGPAIKHIALQKVREVSKTVELPLIAMGGICSTEDALDFLRIKNVQAVAVGTATFRDPMTMIKIVKGLTEYFKEKGYANLEELKVREG